MTLSYVKAGLYGDLHSAAARWAGANRNCATLARWAPHLRQVRYEDLVANPTRAFGDLFAWADLEFRPEMLDIQPQRMGDVEVLAHHERVADKISANSVGKWREQEEAIRSAALPPQFFREMSLLGYS